VPKQLGADAEANVPATTWERGLARAVGH